jgi:hypothetical protein
MSSPFSEPSKQLQPSTGADSPNWRERRLEYPEVTQVASPGGSGKIFNFKTTSPSHVWRMRSINSPSSNMERSAIAATAQGASSPLTPERKWEGIQTCIINHLNSGHSMRAHVKSKSTSVGGTCIFVALNSYVEQHCTVIATARIKISDRIGETSTIITVTTANGSRVSTIIDAGNPRSYTAVKMGEYLKSISEHLLTFYDSK